MLGACLCWIISFMLKYYSDGLQHAGYLNLYGKMYKYVTLAGGTRRYAKNFRTANVDS